MLTTEIKTRSMSPFAYNAGSKKRIDNFRQTGEAGIPEIPRHSGSRTSLGTKSAPPLENGPPLHVLNKNLKRGRTDHPPY